MKVTIEELLARIKALEQESRGALMLREMVTPVTSQSGIGGDIRSDCGCCDPTNCVTLNSESQIPEVILATRYTFRLPTLFNCLCDLEEGSPGGDVTMDSVDGSITQFRSEVFQCLGQPSETEACSTTAHWEWQESTCEDECTFYTDPSSGPMGEFGPDFAWQAATSPPETAPDVPCDTPGGCGCSIPSEPPTDYGQSTTSPCLPFGEAEGWVLTSLDDPDCDCTPVEPDFEGELEQTAETECVGTKVVEGEEDYLDSYWELNIGSQSTDYYGCEEASTLSFVVGGEVRLKYKIPNPCKPFCRMCENKFELVSCGPFKCINIPGVICVKPDITTYVPCSLCKNQRIPKYWYLEWPIDCPMKTGIYIITMGEGCGGTFRYCMPIQFAAGQLGCQRNETSLEDFQPAIDYWENVGIYNQQPTFGDVACFPGVWNPLNNQVMHTYCNNYGELLFASGASDSVTLIPGPNGDGPNYSIASPDIDFEEEGCDRIYVLTRGAYPDCGVQHTYPVVDPPLSIEWPETVTIIPIHGLE